MKHRHPDASARVLSSTEAGQQRKDSQSFYRQCYERHVSDQPHQAAGRGDADRLSDKQSFPKSDALPENKKQERCAGHEPKPTHLYEYQDHRLPKQGPVGAGVQHHEPGNAHGGGRREQCIEKRCRPPRCRADRKKEQRCSNKDYDRESAKERERGCKGPLPPVCRFNGERPRDAYRMPGPDLHAIAARHIALLHRRAPISIISGNSGQYIPHSVAHWQ